MKQPTQEQIKRFWEWCGFKIKRTYHDFYELESPLKEQYWFGLPPCPIKNYPPIDLNNLFLYAVPKVIDIIMAEQECSSDVAYAILFKKWLQELELDIPNHDGTLFWALDKVREAI